MNGSVVAVFFWQLGDQYDDLFTSDVNKSQHVNQRQDVTLYLSYIDAFSLETFLKFNCFLQDVLYCTLKACIEHEQRRKSEERNWG